MHGAEKRVTLVKKRIAKHRRKQARRDIRSLSALRILLFLSLVGAVETMQGRPMDTVGMYGAILLHGGVGGYVLVTVAVSTLAMVITVICMRLHERERQERKRERKDKGDAM